MSARHVPHVGKGCVDIGEQSLDLFVAEAGEGRSQAASRARV